MNLWYYNQRQDVHSHRHCPGLSQYSFIKYWGNRDQHLRLPSNGSISMNLDGLFTRTRVTFEAALTEDILSLNGRQITGPGLQRVQALLDDVRRMAGSSLQAEVYSENNFPTGAGIASCLSI